MLFPEPFGVVQVGSEEPDSQSQRDKGSHDEPLHDWVPREGKEAGLLIPSTARETHRWRASPDHRAKKDADESRAL